MRFEKIENLLKLLDSNKINEDAFYQVLINAEKVSSNGNAIIKLVDSGIIKTFLKEYPDMVVKQPDVLINRILKNERKR